MSKKIKSAFITFALASVVTLSAALSACTIKTDHPTAKITVSFNEVEYNIEYKLYRNMYPQTVQHFIELADAGFYNDMIVHDFKDGSDWFTGAYAYNEPENNKVEGKDYDENAEVLEYNRAYDNGALGEYLERNNKEGKYYELFANDVLTPSVYEKWTNVEDKKGYKTEVSKDDALPTLIGEFGEQHPIDKNPLTAKFGALKMFYYDKGTSNQQVVVNNWAGQILPATYNYNCATSVFSMQVGSSSYGASKYCVFAELKNDKANDELEDLIEAIDDYKTEVTSSKFITSNVKTRVDTLDAFAVDGDIEVAFSMTSVPIIIKTVKITKY